MSFSIRPAAPVDVPALVGLIRELAEFEQLTHLVQTSPERLHEHLFGERPVVEAVVAESAGLVVGFALFFTNYSTFLSLPGLYLVGPEQLSSRRLAPLGRALIAS